MHDFQLKDEHGKLNVPLVAAGVAVIVAAGLGYFLYSANAMLAETRTLLEETQSSLTAKEEENRLLSEALYSEQEKNNDLEEQIEDIADTVGMLEKLSETDPELLQKYSKIYFLNEHYAPSQFSEIDEDYRYPEDEVMHVHKQVWPFLENLLEAAHRDDVDIRVASAFRSFGEQSSLKSQYSVTYGAGSANQFSADQGYSEHQLGTTVDFTSVATGGGLDGFNMTPAYEWLLDNAYKYGFVLSYPENNAYYVFEPWHWRFVGKDLARDLHRRDIGFYDMDQRDIDEYLVSIFDR